MFTYFVLIKTSKRGVFIAIHNINAYLSVILWHTERMELVVKLPICLTVSKDKSIIVYLRIVVIEIIYSVKTSE